MEAEFTIETKDRILSIYQDEGYNPREHENLGTMICSHKRYDLGDKHDFNFDDYRNWDEAEKGIKRKYDAAIILPLFLYDHSGITMNTTGFSCPWDSGRVGFIIISKDKLRKEYSVKRIGKKLVERVTGYLKSEVETYDMYLTGECYRFEVTDLDDNHIDSCGGFLGSDFSTNGMTDYLDDELAELLEKH